MMDLSECRTMEADCRHTVLIYAQARLLNYASRFVHAKWAASLWVLVHTPIADHYPVRNQIWKINLSWLQNACRFARQSIGSIPKLFTSVELFIKHVRRAIFLLNWHGFSLWTGRGTIFVKLPLISNGFIGNIRRNVTRRHDITIPLSTTASDRERLDVTTTQDCSTQSMGTACGFIWVLDKPWQGKSRFLPKFPLTVFHNLCPQFELMSRNRTVVGPSVQ